MSHIKAHGFIAWTSNGKSVGSIIPLKHLGSSIKIRESTLQYPELFAAYK